MSIKACLAAAAAITLMSVPASALVMQQSAIMTENGQKFSFNFTGLLPSTGNGGVITIASGIATKGTSLDDGFDLDRRGTGGKKEFFHASAEGVSFGAHSCGRHSKKIPGYEMNGDADCKFSLDIAVGGKTFDSLIVDGILSLIVSFGKGVHHFGDGDELVVSVKYDEVVPAPLPATGLMLLGGLGAVGAVARRRKARANATG